MDGAPLELSAREFQLLRYFLEHRGDTLTRDEFPYRSVGLQLDAVHPHG